MPRGVPKNGFRKTRAFVARGGVSRSEAAGAVKTKAKPFLDVYMPDTDETDGQIREKIGIRFNTLTKMVRAAKSGVANAIIVSGPAGLGKSWEVEKTLTEKSRQRHVTVKGHISPFALYGLLYANRDSGKVIAFDDCDCVFENEDSLNLMKAACDTTEKRVISWMSNTTIQDAEGASIPDQFEFNGSIVFITNYDFDVMIARGSKLAPHFEALMSRSHYLDMALKTRRDYITRIKMVVEQGMLSQNGLTVSEGKALVQFIEDNQMHLRELSLRMVKKMADLFKMDRADWQNIAKITLMRGAV